jgi:hypothetical protein
LLLTLTFADKVFYSCGHHDSFDDELQEIEVALPDGMYLRCCHFFRLWANGKCSIWRDALF